MYGKPWYQSKSLWAAAVTGVLGVLTVVTGEGMVSTEAMGYVVVAIGVIQGVLRMLTSEPLIGGR